MYFCAMRLFNRLFDFYINASIHVAFAVYSLTWITLKEFEIEYNKDILIFIFFASITGYNFVKYFGLAKFHHRRLANWLKVIQIFSFICFSCMSYFAFKLHVNSLIFIGSLALITFFYAIPFLPKRIFIDSNQNLRHIGGLKVYVIAFVWACVTVLLPIINAEFIIDADVIITFFQRFIIVIVLMLPFEIRDLQYDSIKLSTIPQKIGVSNTKIIGVVLLMAFFFLEFFKNEMSSNRIIVLLMVLLLTLLLLVFTKNNQGNYYSAFWVEGVPIVWLLLSCFIA